MSRTRASVWLIAALAVVATMVAACGGTTGGGTTNKGTIIVGGFKFPESSILAQIYGEALAHDAYTVTYKLNLGTREVVAPALKDGDIDLYPGYAATDLEYWNNKAGEATGDAAATTAKLNSHVQSQGLVALNPSPPDVWFPLYQGHFPDSALAQIPEFSFPAYLGVIDATLDLASR